MKWEVSGLETRKPVYWTELLTSSLTLGLNILLFKQGVLRYLRSLPAAKFHTSVTLRPLVDPGSSPPLL